MKKMGDLAFLFALAFIGAFTVCVAKVTALFL
jgi:hypothetical protein